MKPRRPVFVCGGAHTPYIGKHHPDFVWKGHPDHGKRSNPGIEEHLTRAVRDALEATRVEAALLDRAFVGNFVGECFAHQGHLGALLAGVDDGLRGKPIWRVEGACASGGLALISGVEAIASGSDLVLVVGVEVQTTVNAREGADYLARASHYETQRGIDPFTFPCLFARRVKAYREAHGASERQLAAAVLKAHHNASRNPRAHLHAVGERMTLERASETSDDNPLFLENPELRPYLRLADCSPVSDGASAVILASEDGLRRPGGGTRDAIRVLSYGVAVEPLRPSKAQPLRLLSVETAAREAFGSSGDSPSSIDVAEVHDCFHIAEVLLMEALGFAPRGQGAAYIASGATAIDGELPVNTGGGLLGFGHPVGATGVKQALEIWRQFRRECGAYQVKRELKRGLAANMGGDDGTAVVTVFGLEE
ncbi:MAG: thiolase domain-containing protein [Planctomycetota bacterium]|nr:thiolase domain-containing protein [Planctomycetota bacterium]